MPESEIDVADTVPPDWLVAVVAVLAFPLNAAVIVPALKLPEASRATTVEAVLVVAMVWVLSLMILPVVPSNNATALAVADAGPDTSPPPAGVDQTPSPRQKVLALADVPLFRFVTGKLPVTPVDNGKPVAFVSVPDEGVPKAPPGATKSVPATAAESAAVPLPLSTPVKVVAPVPPLATTSVPASVTVPELVTGPPEVVRPVVPPDTSTLVTVPAPGVLHVVLVPLVDSTLPALPPCDGNSAFRAALAVV